MKGEESLPVMATTIHRGSPFSNVSSPSTSVIANVQQTRRHIDEQLRKDLSTENVEVKSTVSLLLMFPSPQAQQSLHPLHTRSTWSHRCP